MVYNIIKEMMCVKNKRKFGTLMSIIMTILFAGVYYYMFFPPLNISNIQFWVFLLVLFVVFIFLYSVFTLRVSIEEFFGGV